LLRCQSAYIVWQRLCELLVVSLPWGCFATGPAPRPELCTFLAVQHKLLLKRAAEAPAALRKRMKQQAAEVRLPPCSETLMTCSC
jgi:hypothetical protein